MGNERETLGNERETLGNERETLGKQLEDAQKQIIILNERLSKAPDPIELTEVMTRSEGMQKLLEEKDKRIIDLTREVEGLQKHNDTLSGLTHYFKSVEVKQIEAPAAERRPWYKRILGI